MADIDRLEKQLKAIADTVNSFKSEAVQLRVVEALLAKLGVAEFTAPAGSDEGPTKAKRRARRTKKTTTSDKEGTAKVSRGSSRGSGSPGATAMISQLLDNGFFKSRRTINAIVDHCSTDRGHHYKANECSPALLRLVRDEKLKRKKNQDGQYEYSQA